MKKVILSLVVIAALVFTATSFKVQSEAAVIEPVKSLSITDPNPF